MRSEMRWRVRFLLPYIFFLVNHDWSLLLFLRVCSKRERVFLQSTSSIAASPPYQYPRFPLLVSNRSLFFFFFFPFIKASIACIRWVWLWDVVRRLVSREIASNDVVWWMVTRLTNTECYSKYEAMGGDFFSHPPVANIYIIIVLT